MDIIQEQSTAIAPMDQAAYELRALQLMITNITEYANALKSFDRLGHHGIEAQKALLHAGLSLCNEFYARRGFNPETKTIL